MKKIAQWKISLNNSKQNDNLINVTCLKFSNTMLR